MPFDFVFLLKGSHFRCHFMRRGAIFDAQKNTTGFAFSDEGFAFSGATLTLPNMAAGISDLTFSTNLLGFCEK